MNIKNKIKIIFSIIVVFFWIIITYAESWSTSNQISEKSIILNVNEENSVEKENLDLEEELKKDWIELESAEITNDTDKTIVDKANEIKNKEVNKLFWKTEEEKNIEAIEKVLNDIEIKKELNQIQLSEIQDKLKILQKNIDENNKNINIIKEWKNIKEISKELADLENKNEEYKKELEFKERLLKDLENSNTWYEILQEKYKSLLSLYVDTKTEKKNNILKDKKQKLVTLFIFLILFTIAYIVKILLLRNEKFIKNHENFWEYFNLIYWIVFVIFIVLFTFYLFPELYALLIFISWSLIFINAQVISSFVASLILFEKFKIWDIIKVWQEKWKIIKIKQLHTVIRRINDYWVIENEEISIPNIDLLKEKINLVKNTKTKENIFSIILSLNWEKDLFEIIDSIKKNIFWKHLKEKLNTLNPSSIDTFKTKYEHTDTDKIKITFYWLWTSELNRKIEKEIIKHIKKYIIVEKNNEENICNATKSRTKSSDMLKKASIIQEEVDS